LFKLVLYYASLAASFDKFLRRVITEYIRVKVMYIGVTKVWIQAPPHQMCQMLGNEESGETEILSTPHFRSREVASMLEVITVLAFDHML
jgi:hypothetical protein